MKVTYRFAVCLKSRLGTAFEQNTDEKKTGSTIGGGWRSYTVLSTVGCVLHIPHCILAVTR